MISALAEQIHKRDVSTFRSSSISWRWRCSRAPEMSITLNDWLWFSPHLTQSKGSSEKRAFCFECVCVALSASALFDFLFFSRHSCAIAFSWRRHASPSALKKETKPNTLHWSPHSTEKELRYEGKGNASIPWPMQYHGPILGREGKCRTGGRDQLSKPGTVPETARKASKGPSKSLETACR